MRLPRPYFWVWNWRCWDVWHLFKSHKLGRTIGTTSLGPLGIYWEKP